MMNIAKMMQQAKRMQDDMKSMQEKLKTAEVQAAVSGVAVAMYGDGKVKNIAIDASLVNPEDKETLEDLIVAALNQAREKMEQMVSEETKKIMGGVQLPPGMSLPF
jgi:hypothetical protein